LIGYDVLRQGAKAPSTSGSGKQRHGNSNGRRQQKRQAARVGLCP